MATSNAEKIHRNVIFVLLSLYMIATWSTMAGMEILGWTTFAATMAYGFARYPTAPVAFRDFWPYLPWRAMVALVVITIIGILVNGTPEADKLFIIGSQRWVFLLLSASFALALSPPTLRGYKFFLFFVSVIAVYAVFKASPESTCSAPARTARCRASTLAKKIFCGDRRASSEAPWATCTSTACTRAWCLRA